MKQTKSIQLMLFLFACMMLALGIVATTDSVYAQSPAYAPTQTACDSHETSLLDWNDTLVLPAFDPALGTLTSVELTGSIQITTTFLLRNLNALENTIFGTYEAELSVLLPDGSFLSVDATASVTETLPGATDPFNPPEITVNGAPIASADVIQYTPFADFVGAPGTMISFTTAANSEDLQLSSTEGSQGGDAFSFGESELCVTYTYEPYGSIGDTIYHDADASGTQESGEPGLPGVVVSLDDGMGNVITATTTITGFYQFDTLPMGTYTITVDTTNLPGQKELAPSDDPEGDGNVVATTTLAVDDPGTAEDEAHDPEQDFGFRPLVPGVEIVKTAGDAADGGVYMTAAGDVLYTFVVSNTGETHLSDLVIVDDLGTAAAADDVTLTSAECGGLAGPLAPGGTVECTLTLPVTEDTTNVAGVTGTPTTPSGDDIPDLTDPTDDDDAVVEILTPGIEIVKTAGDAADGDVLTTAPGDVVYTYVITNTGNTNLADVTVVDDAGTPTDSGDDVTIDGAICAALMAVLAPGESVTCTATLTVNTDTTNVADVTGLPVDDGGDPLPNVDPPMDDDPAEVVVILGQIGDFIFHDANNDGVYDPADGDTPLPNVIVTLTDANGNDTIETTDGNGFYLFDNLPMGQYTITVDTRTISPEKIVVPSADPENDGDSTSEVTLTESEPTDLVQDFGYSPILGSLGDTIFHDIDGNGVYNISEGDFPLKDVDVILEDENGITQTTTTDANGFYQFTDLPLGTYTVTVDADTVPTDKVDDPTADPDDDGDETATTTLTADAPNDPTLDFGYSPVLGRIGDLIFHDTDGDGVYEPNDGDFPLSNVVVTLTDENGVETRETTNGSGIYLFENLPMGDYTITVDTRTLATEKVVIPSADPDNDGDSTSDVRLTENDPADLEQDFGYRPILGSLGDTIFHDIDGNGVYNISQGDFPLKDVDVILEDENGITQTTTTDANGFYLFTDLPLGAYTVTVDANTVPTDKVDAPTDDPEDNGDGTATTILTPDEPSDSTLDFGYEPVLGSIGDLIFHDADGDGVFEPADGDFPLADVLVVLTDEGGDEMTTTTDESGNYLFDMLPLGAYTVTVDVRTLTIDKVTDPTADPENDGDNSSETVLTEDAPDDMMQDFGYQPGAGSIGDTIFHDANGDGVYDADDGDFPLPGVVITLTAASGDAITTTTGTDGMYQFTNLPFGDYTVTIDETTLPDDKVGEPSADPEGDGDNSSSVSLSPTEPTNDDQDFGYEPILSSIGDTVWFDLDGNGEQDTGELGIENVTVVLTDEDGGQTVDFTDSDGMYLFDGLTAGTYTVTVIPSSLPLNDPLIALISQTYDADGLDTPDQSVYELGEAEDDRDQDFGYQPSPPQGSIGGTIYNDPDGIPMNEDDALIADGVVVKLLNEAGDVIETAVTQDGIYLFPNLPLGAYTVEVDTTTIPETKLGDTSTYPDPLAIVLSETDPLDVDNDFGYPTTVGSIGDTIFHDTDSDGVYEPDDGDFPLPNVIVTLTDENGNETLETTDEDGMYLFDELVFGAYTVTVDTRTLPEDKVDDTPTADPEDDGDSTSATMVSNGEPNDLDQDFGYGPVLGSVGDMIFHDADGDGVYNPDSDDRPLADVAVTLTDASGTEWTTNTNESGEYLFESLPLGDYTVTIDETTLPNDKSNVPSADPENDGDNNSSVSLTVDTPNNLDQDYGYQSPEVEELRGSIGNFVFYDFDANGLNPSVENDFNLPLPNVFVQLIDSDGNIETEVTDARGYYLFDDLPMGTYTVTVVNSTVLSPYDPFDQVALDITYDPTGAADGVSTTTLTPDAPDVVDQDFGYWREPKPTSVNLADLTTQSWSLALVAITMTTLLTAVTGWATVKRNS